MLVPVSSFLTNGLLAKIVVGARSEPFLLAMFGASLIVIGKLVYWLGVRNRTESILKSNNSEITKAEVVLTVRVEANSTLLPLGLDRPLDTGAATLPATRQSRPSPKNGSDPNLVLQ
jgi:hypothetical protein